MNRLRRRPFRVLGYWLQGLLLASLVAGCQAQPPAAPAKPAEPSKPAAPAPAAPAAPTPAKPDAAAAKAPAGPADASIVIVHGSEPGSLDPAVFNSLPERAIVANVLEPLLDRDREAKIVPRLATSYRNIDPTTWEFKLRQGVKFHDGAAFDANAVKANFDRIKNPDTKSRNAGLFASIKEVKVVDPSTVQFLTNGPTPTLPALVITYPGMIVSPTALAKGSEFVTTNPIGTGPYKLVEWSKDKQLVMERNADYWGDKPQVARVTFKPVPEESTRVTLIKTGEADIATNLLPEQVRALKSTANVKTLTVPTGLVVVLEIYVREKDRAVSQPLFDKRVREAMNIAIDRKSIVEGILDGAATPVGNAIPPQFPGYNDAIKPYEFDPARAKQLMNEAGLSGGFSWTFTYPVGGRYVGDERIAQLLQQNWEAIGIKTTLKPQEWPLFVTTRNQRAPIDMGGWAGRGAFDAEFSLFPVYASGTDDQLVVGFPEIEKVLKEARQELDEQKRVALYKQVLQLMRDEHVTAPLHQQHNVYALRARIDWAGRADEGLYVSEMKVN